MRQPPASFLDWIAKFAFEDAWLAEPARRKRPSGFICPHCGLGRFHVLRRRCARQRLACRHQCSPTAGTVFRPTKLPLPRRFAAMCLTPADRGGVPASRLWMVIGVSRPTAQPMLRKCKRAAGGKQVMLFLVERRLERAGFSATRVLGGVLHGQVAAFSRLLGQGLTTRRDTSSGPTVLTRYHAHEPWPTPPEKADDGPLLAYFAVSNFKRLLIDTLHGVSQKWLWEYLDKFVVRVDRWFWEAHVPIRMAEAAGPYMLVPLRLKHI